MSLFKFQWLRRKVRKHTNPIPLNVADQWKRKLSLFYAFLAWNAFGLVIYQVYKGKSNWATFHGLAKEEGTPAQQYSKILGIEKAKVIRISGLTVTDEYDIDNSNDPDFKKT